MNPSKINFTLLVFVATVAILGWIFSDLIGATINAGKRVSQEYALKIGGVANCPEVTIVGTSSFPIKVGVAKRLPTTSDRWSDMATEAEVETIYRYDQRFGLCVLKFQKDGSHSIEYRPPRHLRSSNWKPDTGLAQEVAFATPEGPLSVHVRVKGDPAP